MEQNIGPGRTYINGRSTNDAATSPVENSRANHSSSRSVKSGKSANNVPVSPAGASPAPSGFISFIKTLPLWAKIAVPCVVLLVIILLALSANGLKGGSQVTDVEASDAVQTVQTPDIVGEYYEDAIAIAEDAGMLLVVTGKENNEAFKQNHILSQDPRAKAMAPAGSALLSKVSGGAKIPVAPGETPDITFVPEADAIALLESAEIEYSITYVESDTVLSGLVMKQSIAQGSSEGRQLEVNISTGSDVQDEALEAGGFEYLIETGSDPDIDQPEQQRSRTLSADILEYGQCEFGIWRGEPIKWRVLDIEGDCALLISEDILTVRQYHSSDVDITWADSDIRAWLNDDFLNEAFSEDEQKSIMLSKIPNPDNDFYGTPGGVDTEDKFFLLSIDEAERFFVDIDDRVAEFIMIEEDMDNTMKTYEEFSYSQEYIQTQEENFKSRLNQKQSYWWLLRSPGIRSTAAACVGGEKHDGVIYSNGAGVYSWVGVRPALYLKLEFEQQDENNKKNSTMTDSEYVILAGEEGTEEAIRKLEAYKNEDLDTGNVWYKDEYGN